MVISVLQRLGLVEALKNIRVLHIAGTKGKGSTAAFADSILQQCGYSVGLFTSPHLCDVRERCRVNGYALHIKQQKQPAQAMPENCKFIPESLNHPNKLSKAADANI